MPLSADETAELLNWMVEKFYPAGARYAEFTADDVLQGRQQPLYDPITYRRRLFPEYEG
ncbi:MAG: hypothetical protein V2J12_10675 [Gammaproteobacteria bacterium]|nr:hypothetical protein [Gammaproteobacteria bacterium]